MQGFTATDLLKEIARDDDGVETAGPTIERLASQGVPRKVLEAHAETLVRRGDYEYGVSIRCGWLTEQGKRKALTTPNGENGVSDG